MKLHRVPGSVPALLPLVVVLLFAAGAHAEPWIGPGDMALRHDLQQLADAGVLRAPAMSWPLPWTDIRRELGAEDASKLSSGLQSALGRVQKRAALETVAHDIDVGAEVAGTTDPWALRSFEDSPREEGELTVAATWIGERFAWRVSAGVVADPADGQEFRPDGSYVAMSLGNWNLSAGYLDRWWGPGWEGSLILSDNARPVPSIGIDRNQARPFTWPVLRWLGPWRFSTFMGQLEDDRDYPQTLLFGMRFESRPLPYLQIAASRSAQWCGEGRPCDLSTFGDLLTGNDNDQPLAEQPGNQLAGFDVRWSWPGGRVPIALYAQAIGEDEAGFMPSKYLGLFGAEAWGEWGSHSWRAHVEYADTACDFPKSPPEFGCAYTSSIYTSGYRYRGRALGHTIDADGESIGAGLLLVEPSGDQWNLLARNVKVNRAGLAAGHTLANSPAKVRELRLSHDRAYTWGNIGVSVGYTDIAAGDATLIDKGFGGYLTWHRAAR
ncbi:MAG: capsule assembly Wzi family protein [Steroidobacteraceae bacterium]